MTALIMAVYTVILFVMFLMAPKGEMTYPTWVSFFQLDAVVFPSRQGACLPDGGIDCLSRLGRHSRHLDGLRQISRVAFEFVRPHRRVACGFGSVCRHYSFSGVSDYGRGKNSTTKTSI